MILFTRRITLDPAHLRNATAHAHEMRALVNEKTTLDVALYEVLFGAPVGTLVYSCRGESYAAVLEEMDRLRADEEYQRRSEQGAAYRLGNPEDALGQFLHVVGDASARPEAVNLVTAVTEAGSLSQAIQWGIELADFLEGHNGLPVALVSSNTGRYGVLSWLTYGASIAELEKGSEKTIVDPGFHAQLARSTGLFVPGAATGTMSRRIEPKAS